MKAPPLADAIRIARTPDAISISMRVSPGAGWQMRTFTPEEAREIARLVLAAADQVPA